MFVFVLLVMCIGNCLTCTGGDSNPGSGERQLATAVNGNALDHTLSPKRVVTTVKMRN